MDVSKLFEDVKTTDADYPADMATVEIQSNCNRMLGTFFTAQGKGPHPTMLLLHGFPGTENNFDCAHAFNRMGLNILVFHYRGTWGSDGSFSFMHALEDVHAAYSFLCEEQSAATFRIDRNKLIIAGNSVGGFLALSAVADGLDFAACVSISAFDLGTAGLRSIQSESEKETLERLFADCIGPTRGATVEMLMEEVRTYGAQWSLPNRAEQLAQCENLLIAGERDTVGPPSIHHDLLVQKLNRQKNCRTKAYKVDADHSFQDKRIWLTRTIANWLKDRVDGTQ